MNENAPHVAVVGGGLAGITAALRLAERDYKVTLYEQKGVLGGNLASRPTRFGIDLDVYPHMFLSWYHNFWRMLKDVGVNREDAFAPMTSVKQLKKPKSPNDFPSYAGLTDGYSPKHMLGNLFSGVGPPADMFVFWYSTLDLLAERCAPTMNLDNVSVTGFLQARPYMTERAVAACDNFITMVWAIPAYQAAAEDYREYLAYSVSSYKPPALLAKKPASKAVIAPLADALDRHPNVDIRMSHEISGISCVDNRVRTMKIRNTETGKEDVEDVDELLLALPPLPLSDMVRQPVKKGETPLVKIAPKLAELARLHSQRIPIVHVWFKDKLRYVPRDPVGLYRSDLALAFTDVSQVWTGFPKSKEFKEHTLLSVSASNPYGLPDTGDPDDDGFAIIKELGDYLGFPPGTKWGNSPAIDWRRTVYESNEDSQLFINETGTDVWRPGPEAEGVSNLWFAGNFCKNRIGMMTVESAVASGLEAVSAIVAARRLGSPPEIIEPSANYDALCAWLRYVYGPYALGARAMSEGSDMLRTFLKSITPRRGPEY